MGMGYVNDANGVYTYTYELKLFGGGMLHTMRQRND